MAPHGDPNSTPAVTPPFPGAWFAVGPGVFVEPTQFVVWRRGQPLQPLTPLEWRVLEALGTQRPRVVSRDALLRVAWPDEARDHADLYSLIWRLRYLVETDPHRPRVLVGRRGYGYAWRGAWPPCETNLR